MWKATAGLKIDSSPAEDDDWETDPDFVNDVTEGDGRWGSKTVEGSGRTLSYIDMQQLRLETEKADHEIKKKLLKERNNAFGYGGKYGVQKDRLDKSAAGWDHIEKVEKHVSQKDYATGFGGKFGVQSDRVDKSAHGWDHIEKVEKHESQKDYAKGFGGKFGVQEDRKDKSAVGWDHIEATQKHESQTDHKMGFGGKFGLQKDRMDKSASGYCDSEKETVVTSYVKVKPNIDGAKPSNLRAKFENLAKNADEENRKRAEEQKRVREEKDRKDREEAAKKVVSENTALPATEESKELPSKGARSIISTGREGGIGKAINAFNQIQSERNKCASPAPKEPIVIIKETKEKIQKVETSVNRNRPAQEVAPPQVTFPKVASPELTLPETAQYQLFAAKLNNQPDVIPSIEIDRAITPPPMFSPTEIISNAHVDPITEQSEQEAQLVPEPMYQNQEEVDNSLANVGSKRTAESNNLADYIEDTGIHAIALYDYQAADDDEISFDPDDIVTHIEQIDEGWWRGLCKNRYGLFPANYVQLLGNNGN